LRATYAEIAPRDLSPPGLRQKPFPRLNYGPGGGCMWARGGTHRDVRGLAAGARARVGCVGWDRAGIVHVCQDRTAHRGAWTRMGCGEGLSLAWGAGAQDSASVIGMLYNPKTQK
jgi:hypothetical protein